MKHHKMKKNAFSKIVLDFLSIKNYMKHCQPKKTLDLIRNKLSPQTASKFYLHFILLDTHLKLFTLIPKFKVEIFRTGYNSSHLRNSSAYSMT